MIILREDVSQPPSDKATPPNVHDIIIFDVLFGAGVVFLLPILSVALYSRHIKRASTWYMVIGSWVITSLSNLILLGQQTGRPPNAGICLMQAMLIYATPVLCSFTAVAFMLQVYLSIILSLRWNSKISRVQMRFLHLVPVVSFFCVLIEVMIIGLLNPAQVQRTSSGVYCNLSGSLASMITAGLTILAMLMIIIVEILTAITLRRLWKSSGRTNAVANNEFLSIDVIARVAVFSFCPMIALAISLLQYLPSHNIDIAKLEIAVAILPCCAILIFGSQKDLLRAFMFWKGQKI
ncbi:hypothetical protein GALMADRAFT_247523 [Galerina marginata CBS 339.88]|uniref:G-protein coupled receptors family 1 profile domain-containing protein n=1 Tax=Galerina marginata (strain CBS 339.88) TaxID=685588 RepID=A0A067T1M4_GALM3|nr:hypothetical protein GALMADRAFT_247523 [Galerina marginata CBS 339.88]